LENVVVDQKKKANDLGSYYIFPDLEALTITTISRELKPYKYKIIITLS